MHPALKHAPKTPLEALSRLEAHINDGGRLWFFDSWRRPVAQAGHPDAPLAVVQRLRETA